MRHPARGTIAAAADVCCAAQRRAWQFLAPGDSNPADLFTKILSRQTFEKHRKTVLNLPGDTGVEYARRMASRCASSQCDGTGAT